MEHEETECQSPDVPILCVNNCGFFGSAATMNLCSKCHRDLVLSQRQAELAASSIDTIINGGNRGIDQKETTFLDDSNLRGDLVDPKVISTQPSVVSSSSKETEVKAKQGPTRCNTCKKRVGLTGFNCRCGHIFCAAHRYSDKHGCQFDYRTAAQDAIAKANPVVRAEKLDKI